MRKVVATAKEAGEVQISRLEIDIDSMNEDPVGDAKEILCSPSGLRSEDYDWLLLD